MKKITLFAAILLTSAVSAMAQLPNFTFGIKAGANYSNLKTTGDLTNEENILGYQAGIFTRVGGAGFYLQPEVYLGSKGTNFISFKGQNGNELQANGKVRFTTLDVPVLLGTKFGPGKINFRLMAGPVISFIVDQKTTFDSAYDDVSNFDNYKNQALGLQGGAGVDVGNLTVDLRYEAGLSNISESEKYNQKQNLFHLSLGLKLF